MRAASASFFATLRGSHRMVSRARIVQPWQVGTDPTGTEILIESGDVQSDITADITSTLDLTASFPWPSTAAGLGTPYGQEVFVERGVVYGNNISEYVGLGYFRINDISQDDAPNGLITITAEDRMANIRDAKPLAPVQFAAGVSVKSVIDSVVGEVMPGVPVVYDFDATAELLATSHILEEDRLKFLQDLTSSYGKVMFFDYAGRLQIRDAPDPAKASVYTVNHGAYGVLISMARSRSRNGVYNGVVATGEAAGELPPVRGVALDLEPTSPTYWNGTFGKVPKFFSSTFLSDDAQAYNAARAMLLKATGLPYTVDLGMVPNPALEAGDVVTVTYSDRDNPETHIVDRINYALDPTGQMALGTRKQFVA